MASTLSASQLQDLREKAKLYLGITGDELAFRTDAIAVYHDESATATAATVQLESNTLTLIITGGANAGTDTFDLTNASYDTLTEVVTGINALAKGWVATLLTDGDSTSTDMYRLAQTSAFGQANEVTLEIVNNELLDLLITNTLASIEDGLCRNLLSTTFTGETYDWDRVVALRQPDVTSVDAIYGDLRDGLTVKYTGNDTHARVEVTDTAVKLTSRAGGTTTTNTIAFTDQVTTTLMAAAVTAVAGWTGTVKNDAPSGLLERTGAMNAKDQEPTLEYWFDYDGDYRTWYDSGLVELYGYPFPLSHRVRIDYTAGFSSLPASVEGALLNAIKGAYDETNRTSGLQSERLGDYSYTISSEASSTITSAISTSAALAVNELFPKYGRFVP